jgi:hypothetical protein
MTHKEMDRREVLAPLLDAIDGKAVPHAKLVDAGRTLAAALVAHGHPIRLIEDGPWKGVWELDRLSDDEAVAWGLWVAGKVQESESPMPTKE